MSNKNFFTMALHGHRWPIRRQINVFGPVTANDGEIVCHMTLAGLGVSFFPDFFIEDHIVQGRLVNLFTEVLTERIGIYTLFFARWKITLAAREFADFIAGNFDK